MSNILKQQTLTRVQAAMQIATHVVTKDPAMANAGANQPMAIIDLARLMLEEDDRQLTKRVIIPGMQ